MLATLLSFAIQSDPYLLEIGDPGTVTVDLGMTRTSNGEIASLADIAFAAEGLRFVFVGESHDQYDHHMTQAQIIEALVAAGRDVVVGFEMFTRDNQASLNPWTMGYWTEEEFIEKSNWKTQWGFDYSLYRPIFETVKKYKLPMIALNVPRDWVRQVGRNGPQSLNPEQREWVPELYLGNQTHRAIFTAMMGGHPLTGTQGENIYSAQTTWDEGMAESALQAMDSRLSKQAVMVIVVGSGHTMYDQGINYRIFRRTGQESLNVHCLTSEEARQVSRGLADFVYVSRPGVGASD